MGNHPFNVIVVLFWFATMGWLVVAKILPPVLIGEPPKYSAIVQDEESQVPVCWSISLDDQVVGWAATKTVPGGDGVANLFSRVYLDDFPVSRLAPAWLTMTLKSVLQEIGPLNIEKKSRVTIDPLGRLVSFESRVRLNDTIDAIKVTGEADGANLQLGIQSGETTAAKMQFYLPQDALVVDELAPQARMPGLRVGQSWTVPLYSPFRPPTSPMEVLQASVDREAKITWNGKPAQCHLIVYRNDSGSGLQHNQDRGRTWVRNDGVVLKQEVALFNSRLHFTRLGEEQAEAVWEPLGMDWTISLPNKRSRAVLEQLNATEPEPTE